MNDEPKDIFWANTPNKACFGMTPVEAFSMCFEAFCKMKRDKEYKKNTGRRAAVKHTKEKHTREGS